MPDVSAPALPTAGIERFTEFDELARFYAGWRVGVEQLSSGRFEGTVQLSRSDTLYVVEGQFSQAVIVRGSSNPAESTFYLVEPASSAALWWGRKLDAGRLVTVGPGAAADYRSARNSRTVGVGVPTELLVRAERRLLGSDPPPTRSGWAAAAPPPEAFAALARRLRRLMASALADPASLASPDGHRLEQECLRALVAAAHPATGRPRADLPLPARSALVGRAEGLMRAHLRDAVGAVDLCAALGVSDRTLRLAFRERYRVGPMVYYKLLRLNAVRAALKAAGPGTVATVARQWGFHHLGNFAADYRRAFGESPSDTVGRRRSRRVTPVPV
jgi:AraC-like DNA-binding protein